MEAERIMECVITGLYPMSPTGSLMMVKVWGDEEVQK